MATLIRHLEESVDEGARTQRQQKKHASLDASIPKPFPSREEREEQEILEDLAAEELQLEETSPAELAEGGPQPTANINNSSAHKSAGPGAVTQYPAEGDDEKDEEIIPSIVHVQRSCLMTLNDLLSTAANWRPILPDRRHSMPPRSSVPAAMTDQSTSALHTLVFNLRAHDPDTRALSSAYSLSDADDTTLVNELEERVVRLAESVALSEHDSVLACTLVSLIAHFHRLSVLHPRTNAPTSPRVSSWNPHTASPPLSAHNGQSNPFVHLRRQLSDFQLSRGAGIGTASMSPAERVETALLWAHVDEELEHVLKLCRTRTSEDPHAIDHEVLPPEYDAAGYDDLDFGAASEGLPEYEVGQWSASDVKAVSSSKVHEPEVSSPVLGGAGALSEKMRMDLEAVTLAIDRLYLVAPQLHNQRVELKKSKLEQMERARLAGESSERARVREGKQRAVDTNDVKDLDRMLELIGRASQRKMVDQAVVLEDGLKAKLDNARQRDLEKRDAFVARLVRHCAAGRLHSQDAVFPTSSNGRSKEKDAEALLTLPEFMREPVPEPSRLRMQMADPHALLSLPEFVKEPVPKDRDLVAFLPQTRSPKGPRSRSLSAPPLSWLLASSLSRPSSPGEVSESKRAKAAAKMRRMGSSVSRMPTFQVGFDVQYVAEYYESLQHILVFLTVTGSEPGVPLEAEVVPLSDVPGFERECLFLRCGASTSPYLSLPACVLPGKKEAMQTGDHYQIKLAVAPSTPAGTPVSNAYPPIHGALLDADELSALNPTSFTCASCSLPLVHCSQLNMYKDLPSEHWAELVDAWMCHSDQKLHEHVTKHTNEGFWPTMGLAFVGGSYILFDESAVVKTNIWPSNEETKHADDWQRVRCLCGAVIGRCQDHQAQDAPSSVVYRLTKYAVRPVSPTAEPSRVPLSAFIAEDMNEFVHAHATYRFVILDEEEERPRILIWLFKPSMRLAYITPAQYVIPKSGSIHAAKVLYKILKPSIAFSDLPTLASKYPGFPQAEHLYYPIDICRRLGNLLKESTTAYPESMRTMTGLNVGWLQRA